jgi:hypothetical protein
MWAWLIGGYAALTAGLVVYAAHVALSSKDKQHRADAYKVLKLIWTTATGAAGVLATSLKLWEMGLL